MEAFGLGAVARIENFLAAQAGLDPGPRALAFIQRGGGIPKSRLFTKCFMALLGQWPWQKMVPIPPELVLLPPRSPFSIYNFSCWARQTFVALMVVLSLRPTYPLPVGLEAGHVEGRLEFRPTAAGKRHYLLRLAPTEKESGDLWDNLNKAVQLDGANRLRNPFVAERAQIVEPFQHDRDLRRVLAQDIQEPGQAVGGLFTGLAAIQDRDRLRRVARGQQALQDRGVGAW